MTDILNQSATPVDVTDEAAVVKVEAMAARLAEVAGRAAVARSLEEQASMRKSWLRRYVGLLLAADAFSAVVASAVADGSKHWVHHDTMRVGYMGQHMSLVTLTVVALVTWLGTLAVVGAYRSKHVASDDRDYRVPVKAAVEYLAAWALISYLLHDPMSRILMVTFFVSLVVSVVVGRAVVNLMLARVRRQGRARGRVILVGERCTVREFAGHLLARDDTRADIVAVCTPGTDETISVKGQVLPVMGSPDEVVEAVRAIGADAVIVAGASGLVDMTLQQVAWQLERSRVDLLVAPDTVDLAGPRLKVSSLRGLPMLQVSHPQHESVIRSMHFVMFRVLGAFLLAVSSPVFLAVALAIKIGSPGPVFYRQKRVGYKGQEFDMLKFRTMVPDAEHLLPDLLERNEHDGALFKIKDDPRITRVGRILRKYSLDELPQLINVVRGQMTLVGPRPCLAREMTMFGEAEHRRFMVRPGMTGLWQVSGRSDLPWSEAVKTDLYYVDNWSPALDVSILARTLRVVLTGTGC